MKKPRPEQVILTPVTDVTGVRIPRFFRPATQELFRLSWCVYHMMIAGPF